MAELLDINWLAVVVAAVLSMLIGAAWYSPLMFGERWLSAIGKTEDELVAPGPAMIGSAISCLVSAIAMAIIVGAFDVDSLLGGAFVGALCGIALVAMAMLSDSLFAGSGWSLYFIQAGYRVTYLVLMGAILGAWSP